QPHAAVRYLRNQKHRGKPHFRAGERRPATSVVLPERAVGVVPHPRPFRRRKFGDDAERQFGVERVYTLHKLSVEVVGAGAEHDLDEWLTRHFRSACAGTPAVHQRGAAPTWPAPGGRTRPKRD